MKKWMSVLLCMLMLALCLTCAYAEDNIGEPFEKTVAITLMNSKPEITEALEAGAKLFGEKYNVEIEIIETSSPTDTLSQKYAAGDAPALMIVDLANVKDIAGEKIADLSGEPWTEVGGRALGAVIDGKVYGMPLTIEGMCMIYNKTAIEATIGHEFDDTSIATLDGFVALLDELKAGGMENPVVLNAEDWSIGHKSIQWVYIDQDGTTAGATSFLDDVHAGKANFEGNAAFNSVYDTLDVLLANNINKADPLAADYDLNASYVAEGEAAFWLNGTWAWPDFAPYAVEGTEYSICSLPVNGCEGAAGKVSAGATKFVVIDTQCNTEEQQQAGRMFLNWLVFSEEGQDTLINQCGIVTAFTNVTLEPNNPFNVALKRYIDDGMVSDTATYMPSDHRSVLAPVMQAYVAGEKTREEMAKTLDAYWTTNEPKK